MYLFLEGLHAASNGSSGAPATELTSDVQASEGSTSQFTAHEPPPSTQNVDCSATSKGKEHVIVPISIGTKQKTRKEESCQ